jgi:ABC-2 type transport system ATP-binding protein
MTFPARYELAVDVRGLARSFSGRPAVDDLDLRLRRGAVTGFVGPNGAGKTTTIRMLLGLIRPSAGEGTVLGEPLQHPAGYLPRVGAMIEGPAFYPGLSGRDNLRALAILGDIEARAAERCLELVGLLDRAGDTYRSYSLGMKQRLGVAAALLPDPDLLVLDEPTNGLDPAGIREIRSLMRDLADGGTTVFVSSHLLSEVQAISDDLLLIANGRQRFVGSVDSLLAQSRSTLILSPERDADLVRLGQKLGRAGYDVELGDGQVSIETASGAYGADLNRAAMESGIVLDRIERSEPSLEDAFFELTAAEGQES